MTNWCSEDYSYIWQPHLEDKPHGDHLKNILARSVHGVAHKIADQSPTQVPALVQNLEKHCKEIFHRIALDLLRKYPDTGASLIAARLMDRRLFEARGTRREYELLALEWFGKLQAEEQEKILAWIEAGPDDTELYRHWHKEWSGEEPTEQDIVRHEKRWRHNHVVPLHESLSPPWKQRYEELTGELGKPEQDYTENSRVTVRRGRTSPMTTPDFQLISVQDVVGYLRGMGTVGRADEPVPRWSRSRTD